ncbi:CRISPR-associated endoribonuclease Cas6 [bacterium]|nr:CRISPR-associated endoribonuclease Cas6 [bacterium]
MRIKLSLRAHDSGIVIPYNYQYYLSSALYRILSRSSNTYSEFLHQKGYLGPDGRLRKLFTFSKLFFNKRISKNRFGYKCDSGCEIWLFVSSPMLHDFVQHFVTGLFEDQVIRIDKTLLNVYQVESVAGPEFFDEMKFICLSPVVIKSVILTSTGKKIYYYRPLDDGLSEAVRLSAINKYRTVNNQYPENENLEFIVDKNYIKKRGGQEHVAKLVTVKERTREETKIKGFEVPFTLRGSIELIKNIYECGIGDQCSMGFGCVEVVKNSNKRGG